MDVEIIKSTLQESIQQFRDLNPERHSFAYIGMKTSNSTSFIERAAKNKLGVPLDPKKVLPLVKLVCDEPETRQVATFFADSLVGQSDILKDALYAKFIRDNDRYIAEELDRLLCSSDSYIAYSLSCIGDGISEEAAIEIGGNSIFEALKDLISKGYLQISQNNKYQAIKKFYSFNSFKTMKDALQTLVTYYKPSNVGKERNYIHIVTTGVTREGIRELQKEHRRHHEAVTKITSQYNGDINVFSAGVMDTFTAKDIDNNLNSVKRVSKNTNIKKLLLITLTLGIISIGNIQNTFGNTNVKKKHFDNVTFSTFDNHFFKENEINFIDYKLNYLDFTLIKLNNGLTVYHNDLPLSDIRSIIKIKLKHKTDEQYQTIDPGGAGGNGGGGRIAGPDNNRVLIEKITREELFKSINQINFK